MLADLLKDQVFRTTTSLDLFESELLDMLGMWPNAYLYYFYYAERAVAEILDRGVTRGEEVRDVTARLLAELGAARPDQDPEAALALFRAYHLRRRATYMADAKRQVPSFDEADRMARQNAPAWTAEDEEGYAAVMLDVVEALEAGIPLFTALNVPNQGAIAGMADETSSR